MPLVGATTAAAGAAVLYTLASPPWDLWVLAWAAPALLLVPVLRLSPGRAFLPGLVFGWTIAAGITGWAFEAAHRYFEAPPAVAAALVAAAWTLWSGLPYGGLTVAWATLARRTPTALHPALAAWLWVLVEILRSIPHLGMPWGLLSHTQWRQLALVQIADLGGAYAVSFVVVFASVSIGLLLDRGSESRRLGARWRRLLPAAGLLALVLAYGFVGARPAPSNAARRIAVVQGNVPAELRWRRAMADRQVLTYLRLSATIEPDPSAADVIVWPENAVNFYLDRDPLRLRPIGDLARRSGASLIVGAPRLHDPGTAHNSAFLLGPDGRIRGAYDKRLLVPVAERPWFGRAAAPSAEPRYEGGDAPALLESEGLRLGALICFEILFPDLVRATVRAGAEVLVNVSNDSWMDVGGDGAAPRQHFAMSVLRAVEMRRALVRASSGGVSAIVRPTGEVEARVPWGRAGAVAAEVDAGRGLTPYARFGETWMLGAGAILLAVSLAMGRSAS